MAYHCACQGCSNGSYRLKKWKAEYCHVHKTERSNTECDCAPAFSLIAFPTTKKKPGERQKWKQLINRSNTTNKNKLWSPSKDSRVCSKHFVDGKPTAENPYPTVDLGYDSTSRVQHITPASKRRKLVYNTPSPMVKEHINESPLLQDDLLSPPCENQQPHSPSCTEEQPERQQEQPEGQPEGQREDPPEGQPEEQPEEPIKEQNFLFAMLLACIVIILSLITTFGDFKKSITEQMSTLENHMKKLNGENRRLRTKVRLLQRRLSSCRCKQPLHEQLLQNDRNVNFYTGIQTRGAFDALYDFIAPFVQRRPGRPPKTKRHGGKRGPKRTLPGKDEFLLVLMKIRLGLLHNDLADRFSISMSLCSQIFASWVRAMALTLSHMVYTPEQNVISATTPKRFHSVRSLHSIIDASELFIETPKDPKLQCSTWSSYKHHNTLKFLVAVAPNSMVTFISKDILAEQWIKK